MADPDVAGALGPGTSLSRELDPEACDEAFGTLSGHRASRLMVGDEVRVFSTSLEAWFPGIVSEPTLDGCWVSFEANGLSHRKFLRYDSAHLSVGPASSRKFPLSGAVSGGLECDSSGVALSSETAERLERLRHAVKLPVAAGFADEHADRSLPEVDPGFGLQAPHWVQQPGRHRIDIPPVRKQGRAPFCGLLALAALVDNLCWKRHRIRLDWDAMWDQFCKIADPDGSHRRDHKDYNTADLRKIFSLTKLRLRGVVYLCLNDRVSWERALGYPEQVWVCVENRVIKDLDESKPEGFHVMYSIGADRGQLIIMTTLGKLDLRAIDQSWYENRCGILMLVEIASCVRVL